MYGEKYKPFKGVKYITKAGKFQVRMWSNALINVVFKTMYCNLLL